MSIASDVRVNGVATALTVPPASFPWLEQLPNIARSRRPQGTVVRVGSGQGAVAVGAGEVIVMAGPCAVEDEQQLFQVAQALRDAGVRILRGGAYKPRTSPYSFQGLGDAGLRLLGDVRTELGLLVVTEVLNTADAGKVAAVADILQIGARNMQNVPLLLAAAATGKPILLKRGLAATVQEWLSAAEYIAAAGNDQVILCERGIRTFETATRNTLDINAIPLVKALTHLPVIADPSHGTGAWYLVPAVARAAVAAGADGLLLEVHPNPKAALSDGQQSLTLSDFRRLLRETASVAAAIGRRLGSTVGSVP